MAVSIDWGPLKGSCGAHWLIGVDIRKIQHHLKELEAAIT